MLRTYMSLLLASSQTSVVTPPRPKKSSNCFHNEPTDAGKKTSLNARSCRVQTALRCQFARNPQRFLCRRPPGGKSERPLGMGCLDRGGKSFNLWRMVSRTSRKQLVCKACAHYKVADSLAHILTTEGDKPRIATINVAWAAHSAPANSEIIPQTFENVWQWFRGCEASSGVGAPSKEEFDPRALQTPLSTSKQIMLRAEEVLILPWSGVCVRQSETNSECLLNFAVKARTVAVAMGERKGHLSLVTFWSCAGLEVCHGTNFGRHARALKIAVHVAQGSAQNKAVENFCCPRQEHWRA